MTITIPRELVSWTFVLVGEDWPDVDEDRVRALANVWRQLAKDLGGVSTSVATATAQVRGAGQGQGLGSAVQYLETLTGSSNATLPQLAASANAMADVLDQAALKVEQTKIVILTMAAITLAMFIKMVVMAVWTFGATSPAVAALPLLAKALAQRLLIKLVESIVVGFMFLAGIDLFAQAIQALMRHRHSWDYTSTLTMGGLGALGGAMSWSLGWLRRLPGGRSIWGTIIKEALVEGLPELVGD